MPKQQVTSKFEAELYRPVKPDGDAPWCFILLPKKVSDTLPRRGRTTVRGTINGESFQVTLEPDGQLSHWLKVSEELQNLAGAAVGDTVSVELSAIDEPEPELPADLDEALAGAPDARQTWDKTTTIARLDWIHWLDSAKQAKTREKRILNACDMLAKNKKRVCCFDPSGFYSKAFKAPKPASLTNG
ncbi:MAG: YdeI/OmpD-associated family protein [Akkermansiaceae bacterium]